MREKARNIWQCTWQKEYTEELDIKNTPQTQIAGNNIINSSLINK